MAPQQKYQNKVFTQSSDFKKVPNTCPFIIDKISKKVNKQLCNHQKIMGVYIGFVIR